MNKDLPLKTNILAVETENREYRVGVLGVTAITEAQRYAEFCLINYYEIWKDGKHWLDIHKFSSVEYETT